MECLLSFMYNGEELTSSQGNKNTSTTPENMDLHRSRKILLTPPPQKRIKSADLFRAQHGINTSLPTF
ncbi:unnamed protein product [Ceratitis capitata]|uniref:(Mediterranean fruit fly) hypothetical protein n=1 Tax=Ceratitis capitata TaxID=7213 RepID=A0A811UDT1_CERCA|nr:unnamed protein product [Ceratitis capitata]